MSKKIAVGIIGAGQMGAGIAQVAASFGHKTLVWDLDQACLERSLSGLKSQLERLVDKGKISAEQARNTQSNLIAAKKIEEFAECGLVIEAVIEKLEVKLDLFGRLDKICPADTILGSNTSSISITRIAAGTSRADQVMGIHFMNPVPVMKLVELIRGIQTSDLTYNFINDLISSWDKVCVTASDTPGFIVNRILVPMVNEAIFLLQEGIKAEDIDNAMKLGTNQPMGPLSLADFVGLDTLLYILQVLHRELGEDKYRPCPLLVKYVEAGWLGKKVGRGFYKY